MSDVTSAAVAAGLTVERAEQAVRIVDTDDGPREAIDTVVRARRAVDGRRDAVMLTL